MKILHSIPLLAVVLLLAAGCRREAPAPKLTYSNLLDQKTQGEVGEELLQAGVSQEALQAYFENVDYFNQTIHQKDLVQEGFKTIDTWIPQYDEGTMADVWNSKHPDFIGINCRVSAFSILKDFVKVEHTDNIQDDYLTFDKEALEKGPCPLFYGEDTRSFLSLFSQIPAAKSNKVPDQAAQIQKAWEEKGVHFQEGRLSLISVFFHSQIGEEDILFPGHVGVLLTREGGDLMLLEKLAFQKPYQAVLFENRNQLNAYLMANYDVDENQSTTPVFIMENEKLMEGYKRLR